MPIVRRLIFAVSCLLPLYAAELTLDHVTVAGRDLKAMQARLEAVGLRSEYGGPHQNEASEMALTSFPDGSYLELIAIRTDAGSAAVEQHAWSKLMREDAGPAAWAVRVPDLAAELARLRGNGIPVTEPAKSGRQRPDGVRLEWETVQAGPETRGTFFPFAIHDLTPRKQRAYPSGKATTSDFTGIKRIVIGVRDLNEATERYRQAYGLPAPIKQVDAQFGAQLAQMGGSLVVLAAPLPTASWLSDRIGKFGEGPCAVILRARKTGKYAVASQTRWFGSSVSWLDEARLGWRLGFE
jgi:catechol 2,3-dioxygenase-like lactoylglutathione lyase family enzyme